MTAYSLLPLASRARRHRPAFIIGLLLVVAAVAPFITHGASQTELAPRTSTRVAAKSATDGAEFVPGHVLVRFRSEAEAKAVGSAATTSAVSGARTLSLEAADGEQISARVETFDGAEIVSGLRLAYVAPEQTQAAIDALSARADVEYAEPDYIRHITVTPNDPQYGSLYGLQKINAPTAWNTTTGSQSVVVGIIDQGVQVSHPDLAANIWTNPGEIANNGLDDDGDGYVDDVNGWDFVHNDKTVFDSASGDFHATHVAGTIGAVGNNSTGVVGVNWNVKIMSLKFLDDTASNSGTTSMLLGAYNYALMIKNHGVNLRVLNNSYGGGGSSQSELNAIRALSDAGILFVCAAGNDSRDNFSIPDFPANYDAPNIIAVAATDSSDNLAGFSNFSSRLVSIGAPGVNILSTYPNQTGYSTLSGTSMATPHVAGAAALVVAAKPDITVQQLRGVLAYTGDVIPALQGTTTTGRRLNVANAIARALENDTTAPAAASDLHIVSQSGRSVTLQWTAPGDDGSAGQAADYDFFFVNSSTGLRLLMPTTLLPATGGTQQSVTVNTPFVNFNGNIELRTYDDTGNFSTSSVPVTIADNPSSDPYVVTENSSPSLSTGGTRLALDGDDRYFSNYTLPFAFPFYGQQRTALTVSTNGALYFSTPPTRTNGDADDVPGSAAGMQGQTMIAPLWDDLMLDTSIRSDAGVFVVQPDSSRIIFRWQGVTFATHASVNFEAELRSDGTIITRYGANSSVYPVVGISGGEPTAYVVASHTREDDGVAAPISLSGAAPVTFAPRPAVAQTTVQFLTANYSTSEDDTEDTPRATITVTRTGNTDGASTVDYRTVDDPSAIPCSDTVNNHGAAYARCDYTTTVGTLTFNAGIATQTFTIPIIDDTFVEGTETFQIALSNPTGATLGSSSTATVSISDNDSFSSANPITRTDFFVRQQYLDFLSREPEAGQPWSAVLTGCPNQFNTDASSPSAQCDRISVSANFFRSQEFQLKGLYVFHFYKVAFGRLPLYSEIIPDMASVTGTTTGEVQQKKAAYAAAFTQRTEFTSTYGALTNQQFVDTLMNRYALTQITTPNPSTPDDTSASARVTFTRADLVNLLNGVGGTLTRAQVLRAIADSDQVSAAEFNSAFVAMQYYGYLRRDPEAQGYQNWLNTINADPSNFRAMVNGFMNSTEYRLRFGPQ